VSAHGGAVLVGAVCGVKAKGKPQTFGVCTEERGPEAPRFHGCAYLHLQGESLIAALRRLVQNLPLESISDLGISTGHFSGCDG
jgi:hypothetical protein